MQRAPQRRKGNTGTEDAGTMTIIPRFLRCHPVKKVSEQMNTALLVTAWRHGSRQHHPRRKTEVMYSQLSTTLKVYDDEQQLPVLAASSFPRDSNNKSPTNTKTRIKAIFRKVLRLYITLYRLLSSFLRPVISSNNIKHNQEDINTSK